MIFGHCHNFVVIHCTNWNELNELLCSLGGAMIPLIGAFEFKTFAPLSIKSPLIKDL